MSFSFREKALERLQRYVRIPSASNPDSPTSPSSNEQLEFGRVLAREMIDLGLTQVQQDSFGCVTATLEATGNAKGPTIGLIAHLDTFPGACGVGVEPQLHRDYAGGEIVINRERRVSLSPDRTPELKHCIGHDIVTASGNTLLGADDKAGIAIILTTAEYLLANRDLPHARVRIAITPDEEIGRGVQHFDVPGFGADFAYTIDGDVIGSVEDENFNADGLRIEVEGRSTHTGTAKNVMTNAMRVAADIVSGWPHSRWPETTEGREGFIFFERLEGNVERAVVQGLVRDFDLAGLRALEAHLEAIVAEKRLRYPQAGITLSFQEQYRNMKQVLDQHPDVLERLVRAMRQEGIEPIRKPIRGGTDGARLSFRGLPTPNLFTGGGNFHGPEEWVSVHGMEAAAKVLVRSLTSEAV